MQGSGSQLFQHPIQQVKKSPNPPYFAKYSAAPSHSPSGRSCIRSRQDQQATNADIHQRTKEAPHTQPRAAIPSTLTPPSPVQSTGPHIPVTNILVCPL